VNTPPPRPLLDLTTPSGPYEWMGGVISLLHTLLETESGRAFLEQHYYLTQTRHLHDSYTTWLHETFAKHDLGRDVA